VYFTTWVYPAKMELLDYFVQLMQIKRYSYSTITSYKNAILKLMSSFPNSDISELSKKQIEEFINFQDTHLQISRPYQKQIVGALKLFYNDFLRKNYDLFYLFPDRREYKIPEILSMDEVKLLINNITNIKHKAIISSLYSAGLRLEEVLSLKIEDIDSTNMLNKIHSGKGNKDRNVVLSTKLLSILREYYKLYRPVNFLFEGQSGGKYSASSVQSIMRQALKNARISRKATPHTLRHSYASHLLESVTDIRVIQEILGHKSIKTTQIYTHITAHNIKSVKSPLDDIL
jgi:integrase/recombinase XerD